MSGVNAVPQRAGLLDTVMKGVAIARDIYGIKHEMAATDAQEQQAAQQKQTFDDTQAGVIAPKDYLEFGQHYTKGAEGDPGAIQVNHRTGPGAEGISKDYMIPQKTRSALQQHVIQNTTNPVTGEHGDSIIDSDGALLNFIKTDKAPKEQKTREVTTVENGKKVVKIVPDVAGSTFEAPEKDAKEVDQNALYTKLVDKIDNFRGDKAAAQASTNLLSADNALKLAKKYPDPNQMGTKDYNLLVDEIGKIATGGVPGQHTQESISASTIESKWSDLMATVKGQPTPAQLGEFIKNNVDYLNDLRETSQNVVDAHNIKAFNGMKRSFDDEHIKAFQDDFPDLWARELNRQAKKTAPKEAAPVAVGGPGMAVGAPSGSGQVKPAAVFHDEADSALKWAHANPKDPRAQEILKRLDASDQADIPTPGGRRP